MWWVGKWLRLASRTLRISAWVDLKGLRRPKKVIEANAPLMEDDEDEKAGELMKALMGEEDETRQGG
jgi:hypothetical protein